MFVFFINLTYKSLRTARRYCLMKINFETKYIFFTQDGSKFDFQTAYVGMLRYAEQKFQINWRSETPS